MSAKKFRHENLRTLLEDFVSQKAFAEKTGLAAPHVSQMVNGTREMGDAVARRIEKEMGLPDGYMDLPREQADALIGAETPPPPRFEDMARALGAALAEASDEQIRRAMGALGVTKAAPEQQDNRETSKPAGSPDIRRHNSRPGRAKAAFEAAKK